MAEPLSTLYQVNPRVSSSVQTMEEGQAEIEGEDVEESVSPTQGVEGCPSETVQVE